MSSPVEVRHLGMSFFFLVERLCHSKIWWDIIIFFELGRTLTLDCEVDPEMCVKTQRLCCYILLLTLKLLWCHTCWLPCSASKGTLHCCREGEIFFTSGRGALGRAHAQRLLGRPPNVRTCRKGNLPFGVRVAMICRRPLKARRRDVSKTARP